LPSGNDENCREPIDELEIFEVRQNAVLHARHNTVPNPQLSPDRPSKLPSFTLTSFLFIQNNHFNLQYIRDITDPEHPYTLEQLKVVSEDAINVDDGLGAVQILFTPTVEHCSMATLIGLCIRVKLLRTLPPRFKVDIAVAPGTHASEEAVNKQLNDKERVAAALENPSLVAMVDKCLSGEA